MLTLLISGLLLLVCFTGTNIFVPHFYLFNFRSNY